MTTVGDFVLHCGVFSTIIHLFVKSFTLNPQQVAQIAIKINYMKFYLNVLITQPTLCLITPFF
jgi:hypothetical protein